MRIEHVRNKKDKRILLVEKFYPFNIKPRLEYVGKITSPRDLSQKEHSHPIAEIMLLEEGTLNLVIEGEEFKLEPKQIVIFNAGVKHYEYCSNDSKCLLYYMGVKFTTPEMDENALIPPDYKCIYDTKKLFPRMLDYFKIVLEESKNSGDYHFEIAQNTVKTIILYLYRIINTQNNEELLVAQKKPVREICEYLNENFLEDINLDFLAKKFYINKYYMSHIFAEQCGMSIIQYLTAKRIDHAKDLLKNTTLPISVICEKCGFDDSNYFCRTFKKHTKKTPVQYRFSVQ